MPALGLRNKDAATKQIDVNGIVVAEATESGMQMVKPLKILASAAADQPVRQDQAFGVGQTLAPYDGSRSIGATYTNTTGKVIFVWVTVSSSTLPSYMTLVVGGMNVHHAQAALVGIPITVCGIVPPGASYGVLGYSNIVAPVLWREYRA